MLNTRPREQAAELSQLLAAAGFNVVEAPAIQTVDAWDRAAVEAARSELGGGAYAWVVLPSQNAGRALVRELATGRARVVCGAATATALGITPAFALDRFSAAAALEVMRRLALAGERILVPRAAEGAAELTAGLEALGAHVDAPIAYRTVAAEPSTLADARRRLRARELDAISVCSPSAVAGLIGAIEHETLANSRLFCLGETTAAAARLAGLRVDGVAERTTMTSLVEAVRHGLSQSAVRA